MSGWLGNVHESSNFLGAIDDRALENHARRAAPGLHEPQTRQWEKPAHAAECAIVPTRGRQNYQELACDDQRVSVSRPSNGFVSRLESRWRRRRASAGLDLTRTSRHPEPDRRVVDPAGRRFVVRAVRADDQLENQPIRPPVAVLVDWVLLLLRAGYRAVRRRPLRTPGFVVGVIDQRPFLGGVVHTEAVALESGIAQKISELSALIEAGEFS
jgi:hypothetical protein